MRMINMVLGRFGLRLVNLMEANSAVESLREADREYWSKEVSARDNEIDELRERNRELLKRVARHVASVHYYKKNYRLLKGNDQPTTGS